jgi:hypothetical protein
MVVDLSVSAVDAKYVKISNQSNFYGHRWRIFKDNEVPDWELEPGDDGPRTVYVKFRDAAGNESEVVHDQIIIDRTAPFDGSLVVNNGEQYTTAQNKEIQLEIFAREADSLLISQQADFGDARWEPYITSKRLTLEGEDGKKTVFLKFKDLAGNESPVFSGEVILDTTPPKDCTVLINGGAETTNQIDKMVTLNISAPDAKYMLISNSPTLQDGRWTGVEPIVENWQLDAEKDGMRTIYVKFKDEAGNISSTFKASIMLERGF